MRPLKKITLFALFVAGISTTSIATTILDDDFNYNTQDIEVLASEALTNADDFQVLPLNEDQQNHRYKIYNTDKKLVYECRDAQDARLKCLLKRSDLLMTTDSSSYYYLAD